MVREILRTNYSLEIVLDISLEIASEILSDLFGMLSVCFMFDPRRQMWCLCSNEH